MIVIDFWRGHVLEYECVHGGNPPPVQFLSQTDREAGRQLIANRGKYPQRTPAQWATSKPQFEEEFYLEGVLRQYLGARSKAEVSQKRKSFRVNEMEVVNPSPALTHPFTIAGGKETEVNSTGDVTPYKYTLFGN